MENEIRRIYVGGLCEDVKKEDLIARFGKFGEIVDVEIVPYSKEEVLRCRGFVFINIRCNKNDLAKMFSTYNNSRFKGRLMRLELAKPVDHKRKPHGSVSTRHTRKRKARVKHSVNIDSIVNRFNYRKFKHWKKLNNGKLISVMMVRFPDGTIKSVESHSSTKLFLSDENRDTQNQHVEEQEQYHEEDVKYSKHNAKEVVDKDLSLELDGKTIDSTFETKTDRGVVMKRSWADIVKDANIQSIPPKEENKSGKGRGVCSENRERVSQPFFIDISKISARQCFFPPNSLEERERTWKEKISSISEEFERAIEKRNTMAMSKDSKSSTETRSGGSGGDIGEILTHYEGDKPLNVIDPQTGEVDWNCPCMEELLSPPCGNLFKKAFECFAKSERNGGSNCTEAFVEWKNCYLSNLDKCAKDDK